jgi:hypothetical protein
LKKVTAFAIVIFNLVWAQANTLRLDPKRCLADLPQEPQVYTSDFKWNMSLQDIRDASLKMYNSEKRLAQRAFLNSNNELVFPNDDFRGGPIKLPMTFVNAVTKHIEKAFERGYIDAVLFPDMGHSHFLIPLAQYKKEIEPIPVNKFNVLYEKIFNSPNIKVVYHTAEQLRVMDESKKLIDDKYLQWRYYTRNLVGHNNANPDIELVNATATSNANTMGEVSGYYWWGGGFNIHANKNGCLSYKKDGKFFYYDISLQDLKPDPSLGDFN